jgi:hypothetical protein
MKKEDYIITYKFLHSWGLKVVEAIRSRIRKDKLIDTGALLNSIDYDIVDSNNSFNLIFKIGDGKFKRGSGLPSEYGVYLDKGTQFINPYYFFTAPIPTLTQKEFIMQLKAAMSKDIEKYLIKKLK